MTVPLAVSPSNPVPGLHLTVDLLRGANSPGISPVKALIIAQHNSTPGDQTADTEVRQVSSNEDCETATGTASLAKHTFKALFANNGEALVDLVAVAEPTGTPATGSFTIVGTPNANVTIEIDISGYIILVPWANGTADTAQKTIVTAAINAASRDLFCTAADGAGGVVDLTARSNGVVGNDIKISCRILGSGGSISCTASAATLTSGTGSPDMTNALETVKNEEYDYIIPCIASSEAEDASTGNHVRVNTHIDTYFTGLTAKLQQGVWATTNGDAAAITGAVGRNDPICTANHVRNGRELPCELAGADVGNRMYRVSRNANPNRIGTVPLGLRRGAKDHVTDTPTQSELQSLLNSGVAAWSYANNGDLYMVRPITTHSQDDDGNQDRRVFDNNEVDAVFAVAKDLRAAIPQQFPQAKITRDVVEASADELPPDVVEERDIKAFIDNRIRGFWIPKGVVDLNKWTQAVADGKFIVKVNDSDETQVDIFLPIEPFKVLAKFGLYLAKAS